MSYRPFKKQTRIKIDLRKLSDFDLYFEEVPPLAMYKVQKALNRNIRKLKLA